MTRIKLLEDLMVQQPYSTLEQVQTHVDICNRPGAEVHPCEVTPEVFEAIVGDDLNAKKIQMGKNGVEIFRAGTMGDIRKWEKRDAKDSIPGEIQLPGPMQHR